MFFCLCSFQAELSKSPSWRPSYKYYNSWLSLLSFVLCVVLMFLINWWSAVVAIVFVGILYVFVEYRKPKVNVIIQIFFIFKYNYLP